MSQGQGHGQGPGPRAASLTVTLTLVAQSHLGTITTVLDHRTGSLPGALLRARAHPEWADADGGGDDKDDAVAELAVELG